MEIFGKLEEFGSELYPYRYVVGPLLVAVIAGALYLGYRLVWHQVLMRHQRLSLAIGGPLVVVIGFVGYYTLSPLWQRSTLVEASPLVAAEATPTPEVAREPTMTPTPGATDTPAAATATAPATGSPSAGASPSTPPPSATPTTAPTIAAPTPTEDAEFTPRVVSEGTWEGADDFHFARGKALLIESEPGKYVVRVEEFSVRNGPDLFVYLSPSADGYADGALNLGGLKATDGAFNYEVPAGTDISQFKSVVVWCRQFAVLFGTAALG